MQVSHRPSNMASHSMFRPHKSSGSEIGRWLHLFHNLAFLHLDDVADAFVFDIIDCAPISDKFADYFCSTYVETTTFPPLLWAQIPSDVGYIERTMDQNHFTDISVVNSYPIIL